ncbi:MULTISPECIES: MFS transporter [Prauserella salsuginis group]|uniref:MFS transporter n=1 Tax=Prauserella salsuginis TaxID=387889 RepID=A0ABW6G7N6_9PSEU|nr:MULTISPECIES: MFS transporter [Prauserella salsuginis group]MCR3719541.1 Cyanate permease [Prauserella flava]MCR3735445.1 Cyanate permease [Prauserella salsuginis]
MPTATNTTTPLPGRAHTTRVVSAAAVALALTAPGQTAAMSVFIDPIIEDLDISRSLVSGAYLIGSLSGTLVLPLLGRLIDRYGPRRIMATIAACFGLILIVSSAASEITGLTAAFIGVRVGGQGALNLVATTTVAIYVHRRRGFAIGLSSAIGTAGISLAPVLLERLIAVADWRTVWIGEGIAVWLLVIPAALILLPRTPPAPPRGGEADDRPRGPLPTVDWTRGQAMRTGMFWAVAAGVAVCSLVTTGLNFHQVSLLGERGLSATEAAATFLPQTIAGLITAFGLGWLADRFSDRVLIVLTMLLLALATAGAGWVTPGFTAVLYGVALGACANGVRTLEAVAFPRCFGLRHLGAIRGVVHSITVGASAFGPLLVAMGHDVADTYRAILLMLTALPVTVAIAAVLVRTPPPAPPERH